MIAEIDNTTVDQDTSRTIMALKDALYLAELDYRQDLEALKELCRKLGYPGEVIERVENEPGPILGLAKLLYIKGATTP